jgi:RNA polymerase sigma-70 factor (ECF subfamily)
LSQREISSSASPPSAAPRALRPFDELYAEYARFVSHDAMRRGVPRSAVDDVVQEVFVVVHRRMAAFESQSAMREWLSTIVQDVSRDHVEPVRPDRPAATFASQDVARHEGPAEAVDHKIVATLLDGLLARMSEVQREVFVMHELEHMTVEEITRALHANRNTIYARLRTARRIFERGIRPYRSA